MRSLLAAGLLLFAVPTVFCATLKGFEKQFQGTGASRSIGQAAGEVALKDDDGSLLKLTLLAFALPYAYSLNLPEEGFSPGLYAGGRGDSGDAPRQQRLELSWHRAGMEVSGWGGRWRLDSEKHVGAEVFWSDYIERREEDLHYVGASAAGDLLREEPGRAGFQLGLAALSGRLTRVGPRLALEAELFPRKPFFLDALAAAAFIDGGPLGELRAGAGAAFGRAQVRFGYKALIGPLRHLDGPELALIVRL